VLIQTVRTRFVIGAVMLLSIASGIGYGQMAASHTSTVALPPTKLMDSSSMLTTGKVVARVNGAGLTDRDLLREMFVLFPYAKQHNGGFPKGMESDIRHGAMKMIVFQELCYQEALRRKMTVTPARIAKVRSEIRADLKDPRAYQAFLDDQASGTEAGLRKRIERMLLIQDLIQIEVTQKSVLTPVQLRAYYKQNLEKFRLPAMVSFQSISVVPPPNSNSEVQADARKHAESLLKQAKAADSYEKFGLLAEKISDDDFRVNMGYRKPFDISKLPPSIADTLRSMKPGEVSGIVAIDGGYTILRLIELDSPTTRKFADVSSELQKNLGRQKQEELRAALNERLRAKSKVEEL